MSCRLIPFDPPAGWLSSLLEPVAPELASLGMESGADQPEGDFASAWSGPAPKSAAPRSTRLRATTFGE